MKRLTGLLRSDMVLIALPFMPAAALLPVRNNVGTAHQGRVALEDVAPVNAKPYASIGRKPLAPRLFSLHQAPSR